MGSRASAGCECAARARTDVAGADAFSGERLRSGGFESRAVGSDAGANAARDGRGFGGVDGRRAAGTHIGRPSLERLLDTGPDLLPGKAASGRTADVNWDLSDCGVA